MFICYGFTFNDYASVSQRTGSYLDCIYMDSNNILHLMQKFDNAEDLHGQNTIT